MTDSTTVPGTTTTILALDLGKFKSVACRYDPAAGDHAFRTLATTPPAVHDLLVENGPRVSAPLPGSPAGLLPAA
jgi:hypothetical protein